jgi:hypothetical protein
MPPYIYDGRICGKTPSASNDGRRRVPSGNIIGNSGIPGSSRMSPFPLRTSTSRTRFWSLPPLSIRLPKKHSVSSPRKATISLDENLII